LAAILAYGKGRKNPGHLDRDSAEQNQGGCGGAQPTFAELSYAISGGGNFALGLCTCFRTIVMSAWAESRPHLKECQVFRQNEGKRRTA
jgi:hypothetical protein